MAGKTGTIADTVTPESNLPPWLQFETRPELGEDKMYESAMWEAYDNSSAHLTEARGISDAIRSFCRNEPDESKWNWEEFEKANPDSGFDRKQFNTYLKVLRDKGNLTPEALAEKPKMGGAKKGNDEEIDERPMFDAEAGNIDPRLLKLIKKRAEMAEEGELSVEEAVEEKYAAVYEAAQRLANGRSLKHHVFICGDAGVGKSYSVEKAVEFGLNQWRPNKRQTVKPEVIVKHGSIGSTMTNILLFFYENRDDKLLVLDDCDGFVETKDQDVQNFLKAILDPDMHAVSVSPTIRANANRIMQREWEQLQKKLGEAAEIEVDTTRLHEGKASVNVNGIDIEFPVTMEEARQLWSAFPNAQLGRKMKEAMEPKKVSFRENKSVRYNKLGDLVSMKEADFVNNYDPDEDDGMSDEERAALMDLMGGNGDEMLDTEAPEIPASWQFTSSLLMISNLNLDRVNEAVRSRCQCVELTLTRPEFLCRAEQILDKIKVGDDSSNDPAVVQWAKKESFGIFKAILGATEFQGTGFDDISVNIPLEFRLVATMTGDYLARYDRWCLRNGIEDETKPEVMQKAEDELAMPFIRHGLKAILAGNTRGKKR